MDFREMARKAKAEAAQAGADAQAQRSAATQQRNAEFNAAINDLETKVVPLLEEAKAAFAQEGIPLTYTRNWVGQSHRPMDARLHISAVGEETPIPNAGNYISRSYPAAVIAREGKLEFFHGTSEYDSNPRGVVNGDTIETQLQGILKVVLDSYLKLDGENRTRFGGLGPR